MFAPLAGALLSGHSLKGMGWIPRPEGKVRYYLMAWFLPGILIFAGAAVYFLIFPGHFDLTGTALTASYGEEMGKEMLEQLEAQGLTYPIYIMIAIVQCFTFTPLMNMFAAIGEEAGWRGVLYPQLRTRFGRVRGYLFGGIIWSVWHWPLIALVGYEYGTEYFGFPVLGMLVFCIFMFSCGVLCDVLYEKTECIWVPAIVHGAVNAAGTVPVAVYRYEYVKYMLLGPAPVGIIAGLPMLIAALILIWKNREKV